MACTIFIRYAHEDRLRLGNKKEASFHALHYLYSLRS